jgi:HSP20 family protein
VCQLLATVVSEIQTHFLRFVQRRFGMANTLKPRWSVAFPPSVQREMDQVFDHFFGGNSSRGESASDVFAPASLWEEEGRWCVEIDLPGVSQSAIDVTIEKNTLRLTAERPAPEGDRNYVHQERSFGKVERTITLPETVDPEGIEAELKDGVLRLNMAKLPELQPRKVQVKVS